MKWTGQRRKFPSFGREGNLKRKRVVMQKGVSAVVENGGNERAHVWMIGGSVCA